MGPNELDPRRAVARLAAAVLTADAEVTATEVAALAGLVRLGLGSLEALAREELVRASEEPIDVGAACAAIVSRHPEAATTVLAALAEIAASDGAVDPRELALLARIGNELRLPPAMARHVVRTVAGARTAADGESVPAPDREPARPPDRGPRAGAPSPLAAAYAILGVEPDAPRSVIDEAYRVLVQRYQPAQVIALGPEFAVLAVRRLATATAAYCALAGEQQEA
jgi:DnaJ-domain-containing protein 1